MMSTSMSYEYEPNEYEYEPNYVRIVHDTSIGFRDYIATSPFDT